ncbi:hypothetical protein HPIN_00900 [Helicobacter pylori India7]|uniref:Uncharacterized protein n=1 Tax=Helicobacter pylori (strain India7) TaxID=907238 RepID=E8QE49_HELP7|nr:hypothetical protein HPIN_00900 [Helicobacter pylori India7]
MSIVLHYLSTLIGLNQSRVQKPVKNFLKICDFLKISKNLFEEKLDAKLVVFSNNAKQKTD